jgi:hypothetical protein
MDGNFVLDSLEFVDAELIEEAGRLEPRKRRRWTGWIAAAACLCLIAGAVWFLRGREAAPEGVQKWSASMSAQDYFRNCGGEGGRKPGSFASLVMPPYAAALYLDGMRESLEAEGVLPAVGDHPAQNFMACYNGDGSLYKVTFWWMRQPEDETGGYSDLRLTAAPGELHEISDVIVRRLDANGVEIPPKVTTTVRDGITILAEGGEREAKTLTWQTEEGWYQLYGSGFDGYESVVALLDWFWAHPLSLDRFRDMSAECFTCSNREEQPDAFLEQIPDFKALGYTAESELVYQAYRYGDDLWEPVGFEGVYVRGDTRVRWTVSAGADADAWDACLGRVGEITEGKLSEALSDQGAVNIFFDLPCMAALRLEQGSAADAWEIVQSLAG